MKIVPPIVTGEGQTDVGFVDPQSLTNEQQDLVKKIDTGHEAEATLLGQMHESLKDSEFSAAEIEINSDVGSHLRVITIDGVEQDGDEQKGQAIVTETVNGHMTKLMSELNDMLSEKHEEVNEDTVDA